ncbi:MAG: stage II sporulation protein R [Clostridia bacterium]|nr:stage II sporulation protein R [Clostridia bacterium]
MLKSKNAAIFAALGLGLLTTMVMLCFTAEGEATAVSQSVLRFHIVADSDSARDQQLKLLVRDGIAELTDTLFADSENKEQAIVVARENIHLLTDKATEILRAKGCNDSVRVEIKNLYFPTKTYEDITFPAGNYDAIHITLGKGEGQNYWCVMFPALCVSSAKGNNSEMLSVVLNKDELNLVTKPYTVKFKLAEWFGKLKHFFSK